MSPLRPLHLFRLLPLSLTFLFLCAATSAAQVQTITLEPNTPQTVKFGDPLVIKVTVTVADGGTMPTVDDFKWTGFDGVLNLKGKKSEGNGVYTFTFETLSGGDAPDMTVKVGDKEAKLSASVVPKIDKNNLVFDPNTLPAQNLKLKQQESAIVRFRLSDNTPIPGGVLSVESDAPNKASVALNGTTLTVTGGAHGDAVLTVKAYGKDVQTFKVEVPEAVKEIRGPDRLEFKNDKSEKPLSELGVDAVGRDGTPWPADVAVTKLRFSSTVKNVVDVSSDGTKLRILDAGTAQLRVSAKEDDNVVRLVSVQVKPVGERVKLSTGTLTMIARQPASVVQATVTDTAGRSVPGATVNFECVGGAAAGCDNINITNKSDNSAEIRGLGQATVKVVAKLEGSTTVQSDPMLVDVTAPDQITDFRPLLIRMDMMDEQAAKDLFGRKSVDEYYIAKVQLFNKIKKTDTEYFGDSILVYSESLQVRVALQVKCRPEDLPGATNRETKISECQRVGEWVPVTEKMIQKYFDANFSLSPPSSGGLNPPISGTEPIPEDTNPKLHPCFIKAPKEFVGLYRPYSFDTIANTHDRRDERSLRSRTLQILNGAISFTSFVTAIAVPGPSSDLPLGLDKSNNLLIPSFEKLIPSMKEVQRQNILTMVMRNLEEIPFGGSVERKIFFPKGALEGLWPGHRVRVAGISTFDACAEAAIIKKVGQR